MSRLVNYRLPEPLLDALKERATDDDRTMTATVERILRDSLLASGHLDERKKQEKPAKQKSASPTDGSFSGLGDYSAKHLRKGKMEEGEL